MSPGPEAEAWGVYLAARCPCPRNFNVAWCAVLGVLGMVITNHESGFGGYLPSFSLGMHKMSGFDFHIRIRVWRRLWFRLLVIYTPVDEYTLAALNTCACDRVLVLGLVLAALIVSSSHRTLARNGCRRSLEVKAPSANCNSRDGSIQ